MKKIVFITGEKSGENIIFPIIEKLLHIHEDITFYGVFSKRVINKELFKDRLFLIEERKKLNVMGFIEVLLKAIDIYKVYNKIINAIYEINPDLLILVDFPDFNLKIAKAIKKKNKNIKILYFVSPQIWAWRFSRIDIIKKYVDFLLCIWPFEEEIYKNNGYYNVKYIGNPIAFNTYQKLKELEKIEKHQKRVITFFPGSRVQEVNRILPDFMKIIERIDKTEKIDVFYISKVKEIPTKIYLNILDNCLKEEKIKGKIEIVEKEPIYLMYISDFLFLKSGSNNIEALILEKPFIVFYKTSYLNYIIAKIMINKELKYISPVNIATNKSLVPEFIQNYDLDKVLETYFYLNKSRENFIFLFKELKKELLKKNYIEESIMQIEEMLYNKGSKNVKV